MRDIEIQDLYAASCRRLLALSLALMVTACSSSTPAGRPATTIATRMERVWWMASKHVVHLSRDRHPTEPENWQGEDTSYRALMRITRDAFTALGLLIDDHQRIGGQYVDRLRDIGQGTRPFTRKEEAALRRGRPKPPPVVIEWW